MLALTLMQFACLVVIMVWGRFTRPLPSTLQLTVASVIVAIMVLTSVAHLATVIEIEV